MDAPDANRFDLSDSPFTGDDQETELGPPSPGPRASPALNPSSSSGLKGLNRIGKYEVRGELGAGGMGVVLRAHDPVLDRPVAIKVLRTPGLGGGEQLARFELEARSTARLQHPAIVSLHEVGNHEDMPFLVMDLIEGESLQSALMRAPIPPRRAAEIARVIADGLAHAHAQGIIHRDVKPHNILIDQNGRAFLTDFGLALDTTLHQQLTATGELVGTPAYMAPEQVDHEWGMICETTDVYGLGAVLYSSLTGEQPHNASTPMALLRMVLFNEVTPPRQLNPAIHPDLETITLRCMEKMPLERYATAAEVNAELNRFLQGEAIVARPLTHSQRWWRWTRRHRALSITLALLAAALLTIAFSMVKQQRDLAEQARTVRREESLRTLVASRNEASKASRLFTQLIVAAVATPGTQNDEAIGQGLAALEANLRLFSLVPRTEDALAAEELRRVKEASAMTALSLARLAQSSGQWAVAQNALDRALPLEVRTQELAAAQTSLDQARTRVARERREAAKAILTAARAGDLARPREKRTASEFRGDYQEAMMGLLQLGGEDTTMLLTKELGRVTQSLLQVSRQVFAEALGENRNQPQGQEILAAVDTWLKEPYTFDENSETARLMEKACKLLSDKTRRDTGKFGRFRQIYTIGFALRNRQSSELGNGELQLAKLCCDTLGYLPKSEEAAVRLAYYLHAEWLESRATHAARALLRKGGDRATALVRRMAWRFAPGGPLASLINKNAASGGASQTYTALIQRAEALLLSRDPHAANHAVNQALEQRPDSPEALAIKALAGILQNQPEARQDLERAFRLAPENPVVMLCEATFRHELGRAFAAENQAAAAEDCQRTALDLANKIVAKSDRHLTSRVLRARVLTEFGRIESNLKRNSERASSYWAGAVEAYSYALIVDPYCLEAISERAMVYKLNGNFDGALRDYSQALLLAPNDMVIWSNRGNVRFETGDFYGAAADHSEAIKRQPDFVLAWLNRGNAYYMAKQYDQALSDLNHALELNPNYRDALLNRAQLWLDKAAEATSPEFASRYQDQALADLQRGLELRPLNPTFYYFLALCHRKAKRLAEERTALEQFLTLAPDDWLAKTARERLAELDASRD